MSRAQIKPHAQRFRGEYAHKDRLSHHALRLAYCRTEDLRRWFLTQECELFRHKFTEQLSDVKACHDCVQCDCGDTRVDQVRFMHDNGLPYQPMTEEQYTEMHADLMAVAQSRCASV